MAFLVILFIVMLLRGRFKSDYSSSSYQKSVDDYNKAFPNGFENSFLYKLHQQMRNGTYNPESSIADIMADKTSENQTEKPKDSEI